MPRHSVLPHRHHLSIALYRPRNSTLYRPRNSTTANLDFLQHYRPRENVLIRPIQKGGQGYALTGHHEIMIPLLAASLIEGL